MHLTFDIYYLTYQKYYFSQVCDKDSSSSWIPRTAFTHNESLYWTVQSTGMANWQGLQIETAVMKQNKSENYLQSIKWIPQTNQTAA